MSLYPLRCLVQRLPLLVGPKSSPSGILARACSSASGIHTRIQRLISEEDVVVFMKGIPEQPRCGFSNAVVQIMRMHDVPFKGHDVLQDDDLRQGIKDFSDWPTIPQVFFKGEFIGGCDIMLQMHQNGDLIEELQNIGIRSALLEESEPDTK